MTNYKRDYEHSWDEVGGSLTVLLDALSIPHKDRDSFVWRDLLMFLKREEMEFLTTQCRQMTGKSSWEFHGYLVQALNKFGILSAGHWVQVAAVVIPVLGRTRLLTSKNIDRFVAKSVWTCGSCRPRPTPRDFFRESDVPRMQGEVFELLLEFQLSDRGYGHKPRLSGSPEHCVWLSSHMDEVLELMPVLRERKTLDPMLVRDLVENRSNALADGIL